MFQARLEGYSYARIVQALTEMGVPWPSAADRERNPHRSGQA
nr:recombinase family protein [Actinospica durhamensis]